MRKSMLLSLSALAFTLSGTGPGEADSIVSQMMAPYSYQSRVRPYGRVDVSPLYGYYRYNSPYYNGGGYDRRIRNVPRYRYNYGWGYYP